MQTTTLYVDGGYHPKYKQGAYAYILDTGNRFEMFSGYSSAKNSREAELIATELAIKSATTENIILYTDYLGLIHGLANKINTNEFSGIKKAIGNKKIKVFHMQGHRDSNFVIQCDKQISNLFKKLKQKESGLI